MKKFFAVLAIIALISAIAAALFASFSLIKMQNPLKLYAKITRPASPQPELPESNEGDYEVFLNGQFFHRFPSYDEAVSYAETQANASVKKRENSKVLWDNYPPFSVFTKNDEHTDFETFDKAIDFARSHKRSFIYYRKNNELIWTNSEDLPSSHSIEGIELIRQLPELPRGCEITSLAMLINYNGINVDKMTLAEKIDKDLTPYEIKKGKVYFGNPNTGFVGSMTNINQHGLGVFHGPIYKLLTGYFPSSSIDLTGCEFSDLAYFISNNNPVWIIITSTYAKLPSSSFQTWVTPAGTIKITYSEHSVLVTGYDENYVYFKDPLGAATFADKKNFIEAWEQMGRQAVTVSG